MDLMVSINRVYEKLTEQDKAILAYVQSHPEQLREMTSQSLADACYVSRASVFRLVKKLGLDSFSDVKFLVQQSVATKTEAQAQFEEVVQTYHCYIDQVFEKQCLTPLVSMLLGSGVVYLYGTGNEQKLEVEMLRHVLTSLGKRVVVFFDQGEYDYVKTQFQRGDVMMLLSYKGEATEGIWILKDSRLRPIQRVVITRTSHNSMAQLADYQLYVPTDSIKTPTRLTYDISMTFYFIIDQLYYEYLLALEGEV